MTGNSPGSQTAGAFSFCYKLRFKSQRIRHRSPPAKFLQIHPPAFSVPEYFHAFPAQQFLLQPRNLKMHRSAELPFAVDHPKSRHIRPRQFVFGGLMPTGST